MPWCPGFRGTVTKMVQSISRDFDEDAAQNTSNVMNLVGRMFQSWWACSQHAQNVTNTSHICYKPDDPARPSPIMLQTNVWQCWYCCERVWPLFKIMWDCIQLLRNMMNMLRNMMEMLRKCTRICCRCVESDGNVEKSDNVAGFDGFFLKCDGNVANLMEMLRNLMDMWGIRWNLAKYNGNVMKSNGNVRNLMEMLRNSQKYVATVQEKHKKIQKKHKKTKLQKASKSFKKLQKAS